MDEEKNIRAFLAIDPAAEVLAAVARLQEKLKREISGKISWTRLKSAAKSAGHVHRAII
jgi:hypothetical protein